MDGGAWWAAVHGVARSQARLSNFSFTFHFHALEKAMATHSSILAWGIPGTGEPGGLLSMGSHRVRHDWSHLAAAAAADSMTSVLQMENPKLKGLRSLSRATKERPDLECKTSPLGLKALTLSSVDTPLNFPYDLELVAFHRHWGLCPQHSPPHFAFSCLQVVQPHKTSPRCSQRKQFLCCCPEPILPPFPKGTTSFLAIYFASKSLNFNQPHCPATNPSKLKNSYSSYAQNSQDPWDTLL